MAQVLTASSLWLHSLATAILVGYYILLALVFLPFFTGANTGEGAARALCEVSARVRPWLYGALLIFLASGVFLMLADPFYMGVGKFVNAWSWLMVTKHVLVLAMIGLDIILNRALVQAAAGVSAARRPFPGLRSDIRVLVNSGAACGALVLLLTSLAQAQ